MLAQTQREHQAGNKRDAKGLFVHKFLEICCLGEKTLILPNKTETPGKDNPKTLTRPWWNPVPNTTHHYSAAKVCLIHISRVTKSPQYHQWQNLPPR